MPLFWKPYRSEVTQFLDTLKQQRPQLESEQMAGRALLWDKAPANPEQRSGFEAARVPQQPYVYQTQPTPGDGSA